MDNLPPIVAPLFSHATERPEQIAVIADDEDLTYGDLCGSIEQRATKFKKAGLIQGDAVLVLLKPSIDAVIAYWALHACRAVIVVGDPTGTQAEQDSYAARTGARFAVSDKGFVPTAAKPRELPFDCAVILFSSGTTGTPKAIMHSRVTLQALHETLKSTWGIGPDDRVLGALPFHTIYGLVFSAASSIYAGSTLVLLDRFHPKNAVDAIQTHQITTAAFVPAMLLMILNFNERDDYDCSSLRMIYSASAPISEADIERFNRYSGSEVICNYGMTEIPGSAVEIAGQPHTQGTAGKISLGFDVAIRGPDGDVLPVGEVGEITMRGPTQMLGYLDAPDLTAERIRDGWIFSQDKGRIDEDGNIFVLGRMSDMIIRGGLNISPLEIENALSRHDAVADVAVVGPEDSILGQIISAFIVPRLDTDDLDARLRAHCAEHLAPPKVPAEFLMTKAIPRNAAGKIDRRELLAERAARNGS